MSEASNISQGSFVNGYPICFTTVLAFICQPNSQPAPSTDPACSMPSMEQQALPVCGPLSPHTPRTDCPPLAARIFLMHLVGHNHGLRHRLAVSLRWVPSLIDHPRLFFVTILHSDSAVTWSTAVCTTAPSAGCAISQAPFSSLRTT